MATLAEIDAAVTAAVDSGAPAVALLRCNSGYPALPEEMDLRGIPAMERRWGVPVGLSDHTLGSTTAIAAVALGACLVEKHLTLRRADGGPDAAFWPNPTSWRRWSRPFARRTHRSAKRGSAQPGENASRALRRSLRAVRSIAAGEELTEDAVRSVRPSGGLAPDDLGEVLGRIADRDLERGDPITWDALRAVDGDRRS